MSIKKVYGLLLGVGVLLGGVGYVLPKVVPQHKPDPTKPKTAIEQFTGEDNIFEEIGESLIEKSFGLEEGSLDLSGDSPEPEKNQKIGFNRIH